MADAKKKDEKKSAYYVSPERVFLPVRPEASKLSVGREVAASLPAFSGYRDPEFKSDILECFEDPKAPLQGLHGEVENWRKAAVEKENRPWFGRFTEDSSRSQCVDMYKFIHRFRRSKTREQFTQKAGGSPQKAAQEFLDHIEKMAKEGQLADGNTFGEQLDNSFNDKQDQSKRDTKMQKIAKSAFGLQAGSGSAELQQMAMRVHELLPKVRRDYEFAATKSQRTEVVPWPEDDIDIRPMRSPLEIMRVPLPQICEDDDVFTLRLATMQLPVMEHYRCIPEPKHYVLLIDVSGSMGQEVQGYRAIEWATAVGIALMENAERGANKVTLVYFDGAAHKPIQGKPREVAAELWKMRFSGGGTSFDAALRAANKITPKADAIVLISDGDDDIGRVKPDAPLHTMICGGAAGSGVRAHSAKLYNISNRERA